MNRRHADHAYMDATPTSGVIDVGGGGEAPSVAVAVTRLA
jgi:hypothetical protein